MARASPEMRPGSHHDGWAATPQAADQPHYVRRHSVAAWLLPVTNFRDNLVPTSLCRAPRQPALGIRGLEIADQGQAATPAETRKVPGLRSRREKLGEVTGHQDGRVKRRRSRERDDGERHPATEPDKPDGFHLVVPDQRCRAHLSV